MFPGSESRSATIFRSMMSLGFRVIEDFIESQESVTYTSFVSLWIFLLR